jgi:hypothetical protein
MSTDSNQPEVEREDEATGEDQDAVGVDVGMTEGEGSTFEPEEDPEGHGG